MEFRRWKLGMAVLLAVPGVASAALVDRGGGLIYDDVLNITWLQDANYAKTSGYDINGLMNWTAATIWASDLVYGGYSDWRLPTIVDTGDLGCNFAYTGTDCGYNVQTTSGSTVYSEMASLFYDTLGNLSSQFADGSGLQPGWGLTNTGPFANVQAFFYWSGLEYVYDSGSGWMFNFHPGYQAVRTKSYEHFAWAVRDGDVAPVPVPGAVWLLGSALAGLGAIRRRRDVGASVI